MVRIISNQTERLWKRVIETIEKSKRGESTSPACGPVPVTRVPIAIAMNVRFTCKSDTREILTLVDEVRTCGARLRECSDVAAPIRIVESKKWDATERGWRSVNTVIPPRTPWARIPRICVAAKNRRSRLPDLRTAIIVARAAKRRAKVKRRFPNSIQACNCPSS
jgi:hypothetical protein